MVLQASPEMNKYFEDMIKEVNRMYAIAETARKKGMDPEDHVEIKLASNMAERVVGLVSVIAPQIANGGIVERIVELEKQYGSLDWRVAMIIAHEVALEKFCKFKDQIEAIEVGIRIGFAYQTVGVVSSPLEGFTNLELKDRRDKQGKYFCINFSGPIRNAGGTAAATCVLIADYVRTKMGFAAYDPDEKEVSRCHVEVVDYHERVTNLQYFPSKEESDFMVANCPIEISGDASEKFDVSNYKDLPRVPVNKIRSGFCLLHSSCLPLKAEKLWKNINKWGKEMDMMHWNFLEKFIEIKKRVHSSSPGAKQKTEETKTEENIYAKNKIVPNNTYIADLVAGRPVFSYPMRIGGFRLRYGRSRTSGFSAQSINPATMHVLLDFIATGTQCKVERPGKAAALSVCDTIEGPIVVLESGDVMQLNDEETSKRYKKQIKKILFLGDILQNYGDFLNRNHRLVKPGYCEEWWIEEFESAAIKIYDLLDFEKISADTKIAAERIVSFFKDYLHIKPSFTEALNISKTFSIPLHPKYICHYMQLSKSELIYFLDSFSRAKYEAVVAEKIDTEDAGNPCLEKIIFEKDPKLKEILEKIGLEHRFINSEYILLEKTQADFVTATLSLDIFEEQARSEKIKELTKKMTDASLPDSVELINLISPVKIMDKSGIFIGARMGRPEKAKMRKMNGSPHVLFPIGEEGGRLRSFQSAVDKGFVESKFPIFYCDACGKELVTHECIYCGKSARKLKFCPVCNKNVDEFCELHKGSEKTFKEMKIKIKDYFDYYVKKLNDKIIPDMIKGVRGTTNEENVVENLFKGILRAKYDIYVNKDGTIRYDCSEVPITHFKPKEIFAPIEKLKSLGYLKDIHGNDLVSDEQILEIKPQDVVLPACPDSPEEKADDVFIRVANYIDELLVKLYDLPPYYNVKKREDLIGHYTIGLAPHTSAGSLCRIVGFSKTQTFLSHPLMHAAMRRDCDGDESCYFLLLDGFLNFSKKYLPSARGSTMDAPLVLTSILNPSEVDDMAFDMDVVWKYPLSFYQAACEFKNTWEIKLETIGKNLGTPKQFEGMGFTHDTTDINQGVLCSSYKTLPSMDDKLQGQMQVAERVCAVDTSDVARLVIDKHFLKDIKGNLRKFSQQELRCLNCNTKFRRPPLSQKCNKCGSSKLTFTIAYGSIVKYLEPSLDLMRNYKLPPYICQTLELLKDRVEGVFGKDPEKQSSLSQFF